MISGGPVEDSFVEAAAMPVVAGTLPLTGASLATVLRWTAIVLLLGLLLVVGIPSDGRLLE